MNVEFDAKTIKRLFLLVFIGSVQSILTAGVKPPAIKRLVFSIHHLGKELHLSDTLRINNGWFVLETFKFYVGEIQGVTNGKCRKLSGVTLVDLAHAEDREILIRMPTKSRLDSLVFTVGIDSLQHREAHFLDDLDPVKSMYWAWQSGFIQLKLEGQWIAADKTIEPVEWHLGGYCWPYNTAKSLALPWVGAANSDSIFVAIDVQSMLSFGLQHQPRKIVSPGKEAFALMDVFVRSGWQFGALNTR